MTLLAGALLGAALGGGGGSSSSSNAASTNTLSFSPVVNLFGDIRDQGASANTDANSNAAAVTDNTPSNGLGAGLLQPQATGGIYGSLDNPQYETAGFDNWLIIGGAAIMAGGIYFLVK